MPACFRREATQCAHVSFVSSPPRVQHFLYLDWFAILKHCNEAPHLPPLVLCDHQQHRQVLPYEVQPVVQQPGAERKKGAEVYLRHEAWLRCGCWSRKRISSHLKGILVEGVRKRHDDCSDKSKVFTALKREFCTNGKDSQNAWQLHQRAKLECGCCRATELHLPRKSKYRLSDTLSKARMGLRSEHS